MPELGGKAGRLWQMNREGLPVPTWVCVPATAFRQALQAHWPELRHLIMNLPASASSGQLADLATECQSILADLSLPQDLKLAIDKAVSELKADRFAVRSSALGEDSGRHAFAGLFRTWLQTPADEVADRVLACWRASFAAPVLAYLNHHGLAPESLTMAVLIQIQIDAWGSGVLFQASPDGNLNDLVLVAGYGQGEGIVSGQVDADSYRRDRFNGIWRDEIVDKRQQMQAIGSKLALLPVPEDLRRQAVLTPAMRQALLDLCDPLARDG
ncbi:MAG: hypothetical protein CVV27_17715, partial [Candidatus Melainabacteria bacterium HGW-Melainabacteria-1]